MNTLAFTDTAHAVCSLGIIPEHHILADSDDSASGWALLDVDTRGMNLIEEREPVNNNVIHDEKKATPASLESKPVEHWYTTLTGWNNSA